MIACLDGIGSEGGSGASQGAGSGGKRGAAKTGKPTKSAQPGKPAKPIEPAQPQPASKTTTGPEASGAEAVGKDRHSPSVAGAGPWPAFIEVAGAPALADHHPRLDARALQAHFDAKRRVREAKIAELAAEAARDGRPSERIIAAITYDSEHAPHSTNRRQLAEIGVACPPPGAVELGPEESHAALWRVIYGLAFLGIFLSSTDHLDDRALLRMLASRILDESIRDVPPSADMSEFIDLGPCRPDHPDLGGETSATQKGAKPDGLEGPFEHAEEDEDADGDLVQCGAGPSEGWSRVVDRDRLLPRPRRPTDAQFG